MFRKINHIIVHEDKPYFILSMSFGFEKNSQSYDIEISHSTRNMQLFSSDENFYPTSHIIVFIILVMGKQL